jgi:hypothetical protein
MRKIRLSVRINPYNYDMIKSLGDAMFLDERRNEGDLSKSLDWILTTFRNNTDFATLVELLVSYSKYERGSRTKEDIEKTRQLLALLKSLEFSIS